MHTIRYLYLVRGILRKRSGNNNILEERFIRILSYAPSIRGRFSGKRRVFVRRYERVAAETLALNPITTLL